MKKIKVIDLLNKIANNEKVPKIIHIFKCDYIWCQGLKTYQRLNPVYGDLEFGDFYTHDLLNLEVEIIEDTPKEDKKIEKLEITKYPELGENVVGYPVPERIIAKINEIIDKVNGDK